MTPADHALGRHLAHEFLQSLNSDCPSIVDLNQLKHRLGVVLGECAATHCQPNDRILLASTSEDADFLLQGIWDGMTGFEKHLAIFWNQRYSPVPDHPELDVAPVIRSYVEDDQHSNVLLICKSIIYTSCVVRTNIQYLLRSLQPDKVIAAAPVMFKGAEEALLDEFRDIAHKFQFIYFAVDDEVSHGEVIPGIGGQIYERLGLAEVKNKFTPWILRQRRLMTP